VRAERAKQALKSAVYRTIGEVASGSGAVTGESGRTLRVLMYHKVNRQPGNPVTVSPERFETQMALLRRLGYEVVGLDDVLAYYFAGAALPPRAVLITFDDGYEDNLENALPVLERFGYPAVLFVPLGYVGESRPLPHDESLLSRGIVNRTLDWDQLLELERRGVRIESHGISHVPLAELEVGEAAREIAISKLRLEEKLGREVRAFAYIKGSLAHFQAVHLSLLRQAGYDLGFTSVSGANGPTTDPLQLRRYNVEPYSARTFELVLRGACDLIAFKDTVAGTHARRAFNAALGTQTK
jgi:peptidoglycan/xylan/chitin deacetylase (PgdA/CDA1 family)